MQERDQIAGNSSESKRALPGIASIEVEQYRAFAGPERLELGRITLLLGRNNAGKSALCFAPLYFAEAFRASSTAPLANEVDGVDFGAPAGVIHRRYPTMRFEFGLEGADVPRSVGLRVAVQKEERAKIWATELQLGEEVHTIPARTPWASVQALLTYPALSRLPHEVMGLKGIRPKPERVEQPLGHEPERVDALGRNASQILWMQGEEGLAQVNRWYSELGVQLALKELGGHFEIQARGSSDELVNLLDSGAGLAQALPLVVQTRLAKHMPRLWCIEQPELHLHPRAHVPIAELLIECLESHPGTRLLVETHSDVVVLRIRREVAAGRLKPDDVRLYFVDEVKVRGGGSTVRPIELDEEGTPTWWPEGVFAEPQREFAAIRRELRERRR
jgi:hypothetical protein